jgi:hypothetical protein
MSLGCGFAVNSTIPECTRCRPRSGADEFSPASTPGIALLTGQSLGCCGHFKRKGCDAGPLVGTIAPLRRHVPYGSEAFWVLLALSDETR